MKARVSDGQLVWCVSYNAMCKKIQPSLTDEQRVVDVARDHVRLSRGSPGRGLLRPAALRGPLLDLRQLVDQEYAFAL